MAHSAVTQFGLTLVDFRHQYQQMILPTEKVCTAEKRWQSRGRLCLCRRCLTPAAVAKLKIISAEAPLRSKNMWKIKKARTADWPLAAYLLKNHHQPSARIDANRFAEFEVALCDQNQLYNSCLSTSASSFHSSFSSALRFF